MELFYLCTFDLMSRLFVLVVLGITSVIRAQTVRDSIAANPRYFEDQFYLGITYSFLLNKPAEVTQQNLSYGLQGGFIKDIPLNYDRTLGIGIGLGLGLNTYYTNIEALETAAGISYGLISSNRAYRRSKLETHSIEVPIEFRWRNSNPTEYKFWRIYTGLTFAYVYDMRSKFVPADGSGEVKNSFSNPDARTLQYGLTFNFGFNSFNAHIYYSLTDLLDDTSLLDQERIRMRPLRVGLIFYIL